MKLDDFDYDLPEDLIAQHPVEPRDTARLLHVEPHALHDRCVRDLPALLDPGDVLVVNDTRVIPARLRGRRGDAAVEVTLHRRLDEASWRAFARPARRLRRGQRIAFTPDFGADVVDNPGLGEVELRFDRSGSDLMLALEAHGEMPLPPYVRRPAGAEARDATDYQTMFASAPGAVAAPTAALHFTPGLLAALEARGVRRATLTLHVGAGTFLPVRTEDPSEHAMHAEWGTLSPETAEHLEAARREGRRVVAVGTTCARLIETAAAPDGTVSPYEGETDLFILPGYRFRAVDRLLTNFHLPRSTLFMLVAAFAGLDRIRQAYAHAVAERYRFYSYGDATLLERAEAAT